MNNLQSLLDPLRRVKQQWQLTQKQRLETAPADVLFCSFPKSGRTWVRHILGNLLANSYDLPGDTNFLEVENLSVLNPAIPKILFLHDDEPFWKTPQELKTNKRAYRRKKLIFMVRHPADVIVSAYFEKNRRYVVHGGSKPDFEGTIDEFVFCKRGATETLIHYLNIWAKERHHFRNFFLLRYEELHQDGFQRVQQLVEFLGLRNKVKDSVIENALSNSTFERMREKESKGAFDTFRLRPGDPADQESFKARKGKVGGYVDYLNETSISYLARKINQDLDSFFGYSL